MQCFSKATFNSVLGVTSTSIAPQYSGDQIVLGMNLGRPHARQEPTLVLSHFFYVPGD